MYERSANLLEKFFNNILGTNEEINVKVLYKEYKELVEETKKYEELLESEDKIINEFDEIANKIRDIQKEQNKLYNTNISLEEERNQLFNTLDEEPDVINSKLGKIEEKCKKNNRRLEELREEFVKLLTEFNIRQKDRNKHSKNRRMEEKNHIQIIEKVTKDMNNMNENIIQNMKSFISVNSEEKKKQITNLMISNGKDERVPFNKNAINMAVNKRCEIAQKEIDAYLNVYDKMKKILVELSNDDIKLDKYEKNLRDISVKLIYLKAQKSYIVSFLDNERMVAISGPKIHKQLMEEACKNFELDMEQFDNLYEIILKEIAGKATKKLYKELYNKEYLKNIEEKEKSFEKEINNIKINSGSVINSNYWRIEEIKNIYNIFQKEISEQFKKDLSEFKLEETENTNENLNHEIPDIEFKQDEIFKKQISEEVEYVDYYEEDDDDYYDEDEEQDDEEDDYYEDKEQDDENDDYYEDNEEQDEEDDDYYEDDEEQDDEEDDYYEDNEEQDDEEDDYYEDDDENDDYYEDNEEQDDEEDDYYDEDDDDYGEEDDDDYYDEDEEQEDDEDYDQDDDDIEDKKAKGIFNKFFKDKK